MPSQDTFLRVLAAVDQSEFRQAFHRWVRDVFPGAVAADQMALDGKTARRSGDKKADEKAVHMVSALACDAKVVLAQMPTASKSSELHAIRALLKILEVRARWSASTPSRARPTSPNASSSEAATTSCRSRTTSPRCGSRSSRRSTQRHSSRRETSTVSARPRTRRTAPQTPVMVASRPALRRSSMTSATGSTRPRGSAGKASTRWFASSQHASMRRRARSRPRAATTSVAGE